MFNSNSIDTLCAALSNAIGVTAPEFAATANTELNTYISNKTNNYGVDRVFMYNPDAIGQWVCNKYPHLIKEVKALTDIEVEFKTVMPSVTPVCFATMYTGVQPSVHGIQAYEKSVIKIETIFDVLIKANKRVAIVSTINDSISKIFLERNMDYFILDTVEQVNAKACELILKDEHDFIVVYNRNYDSTMHKFGPESIEALSEIKANSQAYATFDSMIKEHWKNHTTLVGFATDHGCHEIDDNLGSHGLEMPEDINIVHFYKIHNKEI